VSFLWYIAQFVHFWTSNALEFLYIAVSWVISLQPLGGILWIHWKKHINFSVENFSFKLLDVNEIAAGVVAYLSA